MAQSLGCTFSGTAHPIQSLALASRESLVHVWEDVVVQKSDRAVIRDLFFDIGDQLIQLLTAQECGEGCEAAARNG